MFYVKSLSITQTLLIPKGMLFIFNLVTQSVEFFANIFLIIIM